MVVVSGNALETWASRAPYAAARTSQECAPISVNEQWIELRQLIVRALRPFPEAWKAVLQAISTVDPVPEGSA